MIREVSCKICDKDNIFCYHSILLGSSEYNIINKRICKDETDKTTFCLNLIFEGKCKCFQEDSSLCKNCDKTESAYQCFNCDLKFCNDCYSDHYSSNHKLLDSIWEEMNLVKNFSSNSKIEEHLTLSLNYAVRHKKFCNWFKESCNLIEKGLLHGGPEIEKHINVLKTKLNDNFKLIEGELKNNPEKLELSTFSRNLEKKVEDLVPRKEVLVVRETLFKLNNKVVLTGYANMKNLYSVCNVDNKLLIAYKNANENIEILKCYSYDKFNYTSQEIKLKIELKNNKMLFLRLYTFDNNNNSTTTLLLAIFDCQIIVYEINKEESSKDVFKEKKIINTKQLYDCFSEYNQDIINISSGKKESVVNNNMELFFKDVKFIEVAMFKYNVITLAISVSKGRSKFSLKFLNIFNSNNYNSLHLKTLTLNQKCYSLNCIPNNDDYLLMTGLACTLYIYSYKELKWVFKTDTISPVLNSGLNFYSQNDEGESYFIDKYYFYKYDHSNAQTESFFVESLIHQFFVLKDNFIVILNSIGDLLIFDYKTFEHLATVPEVGRVVAVNYVVEKSLGYFLVLSQDYFVRRIDIN